MAFRPGVTNAKALIEWKPLLGLFRQTAPVWLSVSIYFSYFCLTAFCFTFLFQAGAIPPVRVRKMPKVKINSRAAGGPGERRKEKGASSQQPGQRAGRQETLEKVCQQYFCHLSARCLCAFVLLKRK